MKIGMNLLLWTTDIDEDLYPVIDRVKEIGFDCVTVASQIAEQPDWSETVTE